MTDSTNRKLIPLTEWNQHHTFPPLGGLRHLVFHAKQNGFDTCIRRVGRRILIDEPAFFQWVDSQNQHTTR
jgi:hypothetical protein